MKRVFLRASLGLLTAAVLLLLCEGGLALLGLPPAGIYTGDARTVWWLRPDLDVSQPFPLEEVSFPLQTNALGLRGPMPPESGPWTLALGCSTTFGWGVAAEAAWPSVLSARLGEPVVNGGIPGWSSHQGVLGAERYLDLGPSRVVLAYIVRDAQPALRPDADSTPTPLLLRSHIARGLAALLQPAPGTQTGFEASLPTSRVPPAAYGHNLRHLIAAAEARGASVTLLAFPQVEPAEPWRDVLAGAGRPLRAPTLPSSAFFARDPIHLTADGHAQLAALLADGWSD